jgi:DnaK suppressor protein
LSAPETRYSASQRYGVFAAGGSGKKVRANPPTGSAAEAQSTGPAFAEPDAKLLIIIHEESVMDNQTNGRRPEVLRTLLIGRRSTLQREIDHLIAQHRDNHTHFRDNSVLDVEDMSLRDATGAQQIALLEARTQERIQLDEALRRLDEGTYGICEDCEAPISPARLRALPFARRCVGCQEQYELFQNIVRREDREEI